MMLRRRKLMSERGSHRWAEKTRQEVRDDTEEEEELEVGTVLWRGILFEVWARRKKERHSDVACSVHRTGMRTGWKQMNDDDDDERWRETASDKEVKWKSKDWEKEREGKTALCDNRMLASERLHSTFALTCKHFSLHSSVHFSSIFLSYNSHFFLLQPAWPFEELSSAVSWKFMQRRLRFIQERENEN